MAVMPNGSDTPYGIADDKMSQCYMPNDSVPPYAIADDKMSQCYMHVEFPVANNIGGDYEIVNFMAGMMTICGLFRKMNMNKELIIGALRLCEDAVKLS